MRFKYLFKKVVLGFQKLLRGRKKPDARRLKRGTPGTPKKGGKKALAATRIPVGLPPPSFELPVPQRPVPETFLSPLRAMDEFTGVQLSPDTKRAYASDLKDFFSWVRTQGIWENWQRDIDPITIARYRSYMFEERRLAKASITRKLAVVKSFFRWAISRQWLYMNPAELIRSFPQTQDSKTGFLSADEIGILLESFTWDAQPGLTRKLERVVVETLLMLGVRRGEAGRIKLGDLEVLERRLLVKIEGKGGRERRLPVPPRLEATWVGWLQALFEDAPRAPLVRDNEAAWMAWFKIYRDQPLLVSSRAQVKTAPLSTAEMARIVRKSARRAGIVKRVSPHVLRATAITHALDEGATHRGVQQMAGWTSPLMITRYDKRRQDPRFSAVHQLKYAGWKAAPPADVGAASAVPPVVSHSPEPQL